MATVRKILILICAACAISTGIAQVSTLYSFGQAAGTYAPITGGSVLAQTTFDDGVIDVTIPTFFFNGNYYTTAHVSTNGFITLGSAAAVTNYTPVSNVATYAGAISPFGTNLVNSTVGSPEIRYEQIGAEAIFQWQDVKRFAAGTERFSFQARLNTATGVVRFVYSAVTDLTSSITNQPESGLRGSTNAFAQVKNRRVTTGTDTWLTSLAGTVSASKMRFTTTSPAKFPIGGETYTFTPTCLSPMATTSLTSDCATNSFSVVVNVTALGSATAVDINASTLGLLHNDVSLGTYSCGPFPIGTPVTITLAHSANAGCTNTLGIFNPATTCVTVENGSCLVDPFPIIPDNGCSAGADLQATIPISGFNTTLGSSPGQTILQSLEFIVAHTYRGDLQLRLTSPSGQTRDLLIQQPSPQSEGSNFGNPNACPGIVVQLRDDAPVPLSTMDPAIGNVSGAFQPQQSLSGFTGNANGNWVLRICDNSPDDEGNLRYIRLRLRNVDCLGVIGGTTGPGSACNDGNPNTTGDVYGTNCVCAGTGASGVNVDARVLLEGPFDANTGLMHDSLRSKNLVPLSEPFTAAGFPLVSAGGESTNAGVLSTTGPTAIVDWVLLELRNSANSSTIMRSVCALVRRNGQIVSTTGTSPVLFPGMAPGNYFLAVRHRNHLGAMTASAIGLSASTTIVNFTTAATFGSQATKTIGAVNALWTGNVLSDGSLSYIGVNNDRDPILLRVGGTTPNNTATGYFPEDVNMDGSVKYIGIGNDRDPLLINVGSTTPNSVRVEQLP